MSGQEELEAELNRLRNKRDDLEEEMRQVSQVLEAEDYKMLCEQRKLDQLWNDYGRYAPEMERMLEEEQACIRNYRAKFEECGEEIRKEYRREMENLDQEAAGLEKEICISNKEGDMPYGCY